ncbi:hypothetical protein COV18_03205 [Candidatus Woesearchaeota archaeon CG10_big_fil_rev_8_21_14_0_10_37_12]|nr:MAG: hypothetical protein COV18_03205 [Candidatus Woesearchaeota archaeon CG10_big_fil_rev_8_21_14_0_10_37_12]
MNKKVVLLITLIAAFLLLAACESKTVGKKVAVPGISGAVSTDDYKPVEDAEPEKTAVGTGETGETAAEVLEEIQERGTVDIIDTTTVDSDKVGNFYPPVTSGATGKDALKERTRALLQRGLGVPGVEAEKDFGAKYHSSSGSETNLPDKYGNDNSAGE